jgi:hypothetical protein
MESLYIFLLGIIGIIIAIGVGLELSSGIDEFVIYILFWMLYIVTIATFINIILVINYYLTMKDKTGPPGIQGGEGDRGSTGDTGICDSTCRDSICEKKILDMITGKLKGLGIGDPNTRFNNVYIKSKVKQMCGSDEFKQLSPYNGPKNLTNYLIDIWKIWFDKLYESGGMKYFENMAAETEFEWLNENPFQEIKQYDVFYWGMDKDYRPDIIDKCYDTIDGVTPSNNIDSNLIIRASSTSSYEKLGDNKGSKSTNYVCFWRAKQYTHNQAVFYPVGDLAIGPSSSNNIMNRDVYVGSILLGKSDGPNRDTILVSGDVKGPTDYDLIWDNNIFWLWRPIAPVGYISLGDVVTFDDNKPLTRNNAPIRCVPFSITIRIRPNSNILWSSFGSQTEPNALVLGFIPNNGTYVDSGLNTNTMNCYNMFRTVIGMDSSNIPDSDINGGFYYLDSTKYDSRFTIRAGDTPVEEKDKVGKGYIKIPKKDSKYSVISYLNLKNNPKLLHQMSNTIINARLIPNAISNAYLISNNDQFQKCFNFDGNRVSTNTVCDESVGSQIFNIVFTGNKKNECKLRHNVSKNIIMYKDGVFSLVSNDETRNLEYQLFIMQ